MQEKCARRYQTDSEVRSKIKNRSRTKYQLSEDLRKNKKIKVTQNRKLKQLKREIGYGGSELCL